MLRSQVYCCNLFFGELWLPGRKRLLTSRNQMLSFGPRHFDMVIIRHVGASDMLSYIWLFFFVTMVHVILLHLSLGAFHWPVHWDTWFLSVLPLEPLASVSWRKCTKICSRSTEVIRSTGLVLWNVSTSGAILFRVWQNSHFLQGARQHAARCLK